jgi:transcriptional regulator with XRE-family HTH domain
MTPYELREWRKALDFTQEGAARALGVSLRGYAKWEAGTAPIGERVNLAAQAYLRRYRSIHGFNGVPLLYVAREYESTDNPKPVQYYLLVARNEKEAADLMIGELGRLPITVNLDAVADAPLGTEPHVIGSIGEIVRQKRHSRKRADEEAA